MDPGEQVMDKGITAAETGRLLKFEELTQQQKVGHIEAEIGVCSVD